MTDKTNNLTARADQITVEGGLSAFEKEFRDMEAKLREVETILNGTDVTPVDLQEIRDKIMGELGGSGPVLDTGVCEINALFDSRRLLHAVTPLPSFQSCGLHVARARTKKCVYFADGLHSLRGCL